MALLVASGMAAVALADEGKMETPMLKSLTSQQFVTDAAIGGMKEICMSQLALTRSQNADIKHLAKRMVTDHAAVNNKLEIIANQEQLLFPETNTFAADDPMWKNPLVERPETAKDGYLLATNMPNFVDYQDFKHLQRLSGREFDLAYAQAMVNDHINMVNVYAAASGNLPDPKLRKFAADTLPGLRMHSQMAQKLENQLASQTAALENSEPGNPPVATASGAER